MRSVKKQKKDLSKIERENIEVLNKSQTWSKGSIYNIRFNGHNRKNPIIKDKHNLVFIHGEFMVLTKKELEQKKIPLSLVVISASKLNIHNVNSLVKDYFDKSNLREKIKKEIEEAVKETTVEIEKASKSEDNKVSKTLDAEIVVENTDSETSSDKDSIDKNSSSDEEEVKTYTPSKHWELFAC